MNRTRFLTGSLATLAVASAFTLATPSAHAAEEPPCGQPEVAAVYETVVHPAVFRTAPAITHSEWLWGRDVTTYEFGFSRLISPASVENDWTRQAPGPLEYLFTHKVIDSPAVPAVPAVPEVGHFEQVVTVPEVVAVEVEYQHENTGKLRWEDPDWGAQNGNGQGWKKTGNSRNVVVTPAVTEQQWVVDVPANPGVPAIPEVAHTESAWALNSPGEGWTGPSDERATGSTTENATTDGDAPAGTGWSLVDSRSVPAEIDTRWALVAPEGYTATGGTRAVGTRYEETEATTAATPEGDGWAKVADSETTVVDTPEQSYLVTPEAIEEIVISPAVPATDPCVLPPTGPVTGDQENGDGPVGGVAAPGAAQGGASPVSTVLPNTGNDVAPWMAPAGLAVMLVGVGVIRRSRRTAA